MIKKLHFVHKVILVEHYLCGLLIYLHHFTLFCTMYIIHIGNTECACHDVTMSMLYAFTRNDPL